jgi:hypothetical protein
MSGRDADKSAADDALRKNKSGKETFDVCMRICANARAKRIPKVLTRKSQQFYGKHSVIGIANGHKYAKHPKYV